MAAGRKQTPLELKLLKGTARADRINPDAPKAACDPMTAPGWLPEEALPHFETLRGRLKSIGLDSSSFTETLAMAAFRLHQIDKFSASVAATGESYETKTAKDGRMVRAYPEVAMLSESMRHLHSLLSEMGLTPAAINKAGGKKTEDKKASPYGQFCKGGKGV